MERLRVGVIGMGYIGVSHVQSLRRIGFVDVAAVADINYPLAKRKAEEYFIPKCYETMEELLADPTIQVVHNCTPNYLHTRINEAILRAGKHCFSEKPLATSSSETAHLLALQKQFPYLVAGVNFNYRMNPLIQDVKKRVGSGEFGDIRLVHGSYLQDWLMYETDYNWRIDPEVNGPSRCVADIGSHWMDLVQHMTGARITEVCADLVTVMPVRKKPTQVVETFAQAAGEASYEPIEIKTEDYGAVLFKMSNGASGVFHVSQVSPGRGCYLNFEMDGSIQSVSWNQERADEMWIGHRERSNEQVMRNPIAIGDACATTYLAKGHPEGWNDAFTGNIETFHRFVKEGKRIGVDEAPFATFEEAHHIVLLTEAILESSAKRGWVGV